MASLSIEYPNFLAEKLAANRKLRAAVELSLNSVAEVLQISKLPFFPDYTDHGAGHLTRVLEIADRLMSDQSRAIFTAEDAAVLIISVLLHDLALHLSEAGFKSLLDSKECSPNGGRADWAVLWQEFLAVAKHWDDRKLVEILGADETGAPLALVTDPLAHYDNLSETDRKLIGEFIRQNHAQMAYEISVLGFPGNAGRLIEFSPLDLDLKEVAGTVARSHGFALRDSLRQLDEKQISGLEHENMHPVFLMGVLRVADFLELGNDRAPVIGFAYKEFKSPLSKRHWIDNQALRSISWGNPEPESILIPAKPPDVYSYLELKDWLTAIQAELDNVWAVFGEVYASHQRLAGFGLTVRRVRSNILDDPEGFARNSSFAPRCVELGVVGAEVLKLFIEPLYGRRPEIGIRELIQNAVDAVRERREFERNNPPSVSASSERGHEVIVWLDDPDANGVALLTVSDSGIGMTEEIVSNYFLKAGASFRRSIAWKKEFESQTGAGDKARLRSRVLRSGRFGIGILASFLLGDEIEVSTKHITSDRGIRFTMRLDIRPPAAEIAPIQLNYDANLPIGTTVKVRVTKIQPAKVEKKRGDTIIHGSDIFVSPESWDWYCLETPSVERFVGKEKTPLKQSATVPSEDSILPRGWHRLDSFDYRTVHARVHGSSGANAPGLVCNGTRVEGAVGFGPPLQAASAIINWQRDLFPEEGVFKLRVPELSIFDPDGNLPLNLQRTGLTNAGLDFLTDAFAAQAKAALAKLLTSAPTELKLTDEFAKALREFFEFNQTIPAFFTKTGTALLTASNLRLAEATTCLLLSTEALTKNWLSHVRDRYDAVIVAGRGYYPGYSPIYSLNELNPWIACARVVTTSDENPIVAKPLRFRYKELSVERFHIYRTANCPPSFIGRPDLEALINGVAAGADATESAYADDFVAAELFLKLQLSSACLPTFSVGHYWEQLVGEPEIPFGVGQRRERLKQALAALAEYVADSADPSAH